MSAAKRRPGNQLTQDNWNEEDEPEESGEFKKANDDELKKRVMKVARRRVGNGMGTGAGDGDGETAKASIFSSFAGFTSSATTANPSSSPFAFLSSTKSSEGSAATSSSFSLGSLSKPTSAAVAATTNEKPLDYYAKLKGLNQSVAEWISKHVGDNPMCILTPIFDDYAKHLKEIQSSTNKIPTNGTNNKIDFGNAKPTATITSTDKTDSVSSATTTSAGTKFNFGFGSPKKSETELEGKPSSPASSIFSFANKSIPSSASSGFSFGSSSSPSLGSSTVKPFTFNVSAVAAPVAKKDDESTENKDGDENEDEPPKAEFKPVVEEDSLYSKRCKVYVKVKDQFTDRGVGTLYIKSVDDGKKMQLIVRADTNLGNILLNILLTEAVPSKRMGKNDVMLICLPTPDAKPPPSTVLVRVKTGTDADDLLAQIEKYKK